MNKIETTGEQNQTPMIFLISKLEWIKAVQRTTLKTYQFIQIIRHSPLTNNNISINLQFNSKLNYIDTMNTEHFNHIECSAIIWTVQIDFHTATESFVWKMKFPFWTVPFVEAFTYDTHMGSVIIIMWMTNEWVYLPTCVWGKE